MHSGHCYMGHYKMGHFFTFLKKKKLHIRKTGGNPTIQKLADCLCQFLQVLYYSWGTPRSSLQHCHLFRSCFRIRRGGTSLYSQWTDLVYIWKVIQVCTLKTEEIEIKKRKYVLKKKIQLFSLLRHPMSGWVLSSPCLLTRLSGSSDSWPRSKSRIIPSSMDSN